MPNLDSNHSEETLEVIVAQLLRTNGFSAVSASRRSGMNFVQAQAADGSQVTFWVKKDWTGGARFAAAISFGGNMRDGSAQRPDRVFAEYVDARAAKAKAQGAQYLLMVHIVDGRLSGEPAVLFIDDVANAYRQQLAGWPARARNGGAAQLWFHEERDRADAECVSAVRALALPLTSLSRGQPDASRAAELAAKTLWAEVERRTKQDAFRARVGERFGWRCAVSGNDVREVLEAAHLPGKDWRQDNEATDGVMLRVDLHRLLDRGLAQLRDGCFWIDERVRCDQYAQFHGRPYTALGV